MMLTIGTVAARTGKRASAIRYYEAIGLLPSAARAGGKRVYDTSIFDQLAAIDLATAAGFELREVKILLASGRSPAAAWKALGSARRAVLDREMAKLKLMKHVLNRLDACGCMSFEDCASQFSRARNNYGRRRAIRDPGTRA